MPATKPPRRGDDAAAPPKAAFAVAAVLREQIVRGDLAAGDPLPTEGALMEQLRVSRGVVREALRILELEGLVLVRRGLGGGPRVTHPSVLSVAQAMGVHLQLNAVSIADPFLAHADLVLAAIDHLAEQRRPEAVVAITEALDALADEVGQRWEYSVALADAIDEFVEQAGNFTLHVLVQALREVVVSQWAAADERVGYAAVEVQETILKLLRDVLRHVRRGNGRAARKLYREFVDAMVQGQAELIPGGTVVDVFPWRVPTQ